jgi:peptidoglycan hydrolase CwlO-like protein
MRTERQRGHDEKRRRMMEDLERREKGWEAARTQEESARAKLHAEMERLRRQAAEKAAQKAAEQRTAAAAATAARADAGGEGQGAGGGAGVAAAGAAAAPGDLGEEMRERLGRTLKVSWSRKVGTLPGQRVEGGGGR